MTTLSQSRAALHAALDAALTIPTLDHEPAPGGLTKPVYVTVGPAGVTPTDHLLAVRVYSDTSRTLPDAAVDTLEAAVQDVDDAMPVAVPRGTWSIEWSEPHNAFVATQIATYPRDDF